LSKIIDTEKDLYIRKNVSSEQQIDEQEVDIETVQGQIITKIAQIVKMCGGKEQAAKKLNISLRWLYYLEKGEKVPGWHLYRDICEITEE
jgi:DNA-binding XRE family transcriptional regulator